MIIDSSVGTGPAQNTTKMTLINTNTMATAALAALTSVAGAAVVLKERLK